MAIQHLFILPILTLSYHFLSWWRSHRPSTTWSRCSSSSSRGRPPTTSSTASCHYSSSSYSPVAGSGASCLTGVGVGAVVALVLTICEIEWRWLDTNLYHLDTNCTHVIARKKERKNGISLSKKSKGVPLPFLKTLPDSFLCDETNEPNALIPSLSRPKSSREWHPHLASYVSEPTNLNTIISNIMNKIQCGRLKTH